LVTLILNDDKSLKKTITSPIYKSETCEKIVICIPQNYNGISFNQEYSISLCWKNANNQGDIVLANRLSELRSNYLQYELFIDGKMTGIVGDLTLWILISNKDGFKLESKITSVPIESHIEIENYLTGKQLSLLDLHIAKMNQYNFEFEQKRNQIIEIYNNTLATAKLVLEMYKEMEEKVNECN
jgi:hypothetical protein